jgi:hypothetical protein
MKGLEVGGGRPGFAALAGARDSTNQGWGLEMGDAGVMCSECVCMRGAKEK